MYMYVYENIMFFLFILVLTREDVSILNLLLSSSALGRYPLAAAGICEDRRTSKGHIPLTYERTVIGQDKGFY